MISVVAHLVDGTEIRSKPGPLSRAEVEGVKRFIGEQMSGSAGWQVNLETVDGWAIIPKSSVLYMSMEPADLLDDESLALLHDEPTKGGT